MEWLKNKVDFFFKFFYLYNELASIESKYALFKHSHTQKA